MNRASGPATLSTLGIDKVFLDFPRLPAASGGFLRFSIAAFESHPVVVFAFVHCRGKTMAQDGHDEIVRMKSISYACFFGGEKSVQDTPDSVQAYLQSLIDQAKAGLEGGAYAASVLDAYLFGYSFAWLFAKEQLQLNGAAGDRRVNVPVNAFYTNTTPDAISTGGVAPDANVLYANAFLQVSPGNPVVVQLPDVQSALQFFFGAVSQFRHSKLPA